MNLVGESRPLEEKQRAYSNWMSYDMLVDHAGWGAVGLCIKKCGMFSIEAGAVATCRISHSLVERGKQ